MKMRPNESTAQHVRTKERGPFAVVGLGHRYVVNGGWSLRHLLGELVRDGVTARLDESSRLRVGLEDGLVDEGNVGMRKPVFLLRQRSISLSGERWSPFARLLVNADGALVVAVVVIVPSLLSPTFCVY